MKLANELAGGPPKAAGHKALLPFRAKAGLREVSRNASVGFSLREKPTEHFGFTQEFSCFCASVYALALCATLIETY
jgi:hypothetical protein